MDIVEQIKLSKGTKGSKLIRLYATIMLHYRQDLGDKAWYEISALLGDESLMSAFAFLMGTAFGRGMSKNPHEDDEEFWTKLQQ